MATKFHVWIDNATTGNVQSETAYASDSQRSGGYTAGTAASSIRMNTVLRGVSLVVAAFMNLVAGSSSVDHTSEQSAVENAISVGAPTYLDGIGVATKEWVNEEIIGLETEDY